ncbi:hypothetical protein RB653_008507 [Dictyostelium firmibasis]|uniref:Transmembrane protein n=1 Tax=Dictyostelium firmibasis TaxID=79012 RepID=A0AAN7TSW2_9MYCE
MKLLLQILVLAVAFTSLYNEVNGQYVMINYYDYQSDQSCQGGVISTTYDVENKCLGGTEFVCVGNEIQINFYKDSNCSQGIQQQMTQEIGVCEGGLLFNCVDNYQMPENSIASVISESCDDWKSTAVSVVSKPLNICLITPSENAVIYSCTSDTITTSIYPRTDSCVGIPKNNTLQLPGCQAAPGSKFYYSDICNQ